MSIARLLLLFEAAVVFVFLIFFLIRYREMKAIDPLYANSYYPPIAEYIVGSLIIAIACAMLIDRLEHQNQESS